MRKLCSLCFLLMTAGLSNASAALPPCAGSLLALDAEGKVVSGSKEAVVAAAMRGDSFRIGYRLSWGKGRFENVVHWAKPVFVTVFENEVFAQFPPIHTQTPLDGKAHVALTDAAKTWHSSIGTNGKLVSRIAEDKKPVQEFMVEQSWCPGTEAPAGRS